MTNRESAFTLPIRILYQPPKSLFIYLTIVHLISIVCLFPPAIPLWSKCLLTSIIFCSYFVYIRNFLNARRNPVEVILQPDGEWRLLVPDRVEQSVFRVNLLPGAFVHPALVVLILKGETQRFSFIFTTENVDVATLRHLRVRLRHPE